ncbi:protein FAM186A-like [Huso huso]|uniref:Protein FAM186A-like n=1 Tax=Huso huso TaxID=61971 RepID=A0ABR0YF90_HUSHU
MLIEKEEDEDFGNVDPESGRIEIPHSVQLVFQTIQFTQLQRAQKDVSESLSAILKNVNMALHHMRVGRELEVETGLRIAPGSELEERKRRASLTQSIGHFMMSSYDREVDFIHLLRWMQETRNMLLEEEEREDQEMEEVTEDWVTLMEMKIGKSLDAFQECIVKISRLCALLFDADPRRKTQDLDLPKGGVWRWWREAKLDAKMIVKIQELQPPSMEKLLKDESLGNKTSVELTNMVNDMKNILSCTKAQSIAFSHILKGIQNINAAFQQQSKDFREGKTSLGMLQVNDSQACSDSLLEEVRRLREQKVMLEMQLVGLETRCSDALLENNKLQETVELMRREADATSKPKLEIQTSPAAKKKRILQPEVREPDRWELRPVEVPGIEVEDLGPSVTQPEISPKKKLGKGGDVVAEVERLSRELLEDFQTNVIDLIQDSIEQDPVGKMWSTEVVNIYRSVEDTVRETLSKLLAKLHDAFANQIIQAPVPALELQHISKFGRNMSRRAPEILQEVSNLFPMLDQNLDDVSTKFAVLDSLDPTTIQATSELRSVQSMGKEQICKMKAAREGMIAMSNQERSKRPEVRKTREKTVKRYEAISEEQGEDEDRQASQGEQRQEERLSGKGREELKPKPKRAVKKKPKKLNEDILRYQTDMEVQQEHILRTKMARLPYGINVKLQRTNLEVLSQALLRGDISLQMHALGTDLITQLQNADETRLLYLFKKYIAFCCIRRVRCNLSSRLDSARKVEDGKTARDMYKFIEKVDDYQQTILQRWREKQDSVERRRKTCMAKMLYLFGQVRRDCSLHLFHPFPLVQQSPGGIQKQFVVCVQPQKRLTWCSSPRVQTHCIVPPASPRSTQGAPGPVFGVRETIHGLLQPSWRADIAAQSSRIAEKSPLNGAAKLPLPRIPKLFEMEVNTTRSKAMQLLQRRANDNLVKLLGGGDLKN